MRRDNTTQAEKEAVLRNRKSAALCAADCAEQVLAFFENGFPGDDRPRRAIEAARAWARGEICVAEARAAALAAHAAARDATGSSAASTPARHAGCAAARAAGHAAATAHVATHARAALVYADKARAASGGQGRPAQAPGHDDRTKNRSSRPPR